MEADQLAWKGMKGMVKGVKAGASGALKVAEKTSMAVLETNDKLNEMQYSGASGPKKTTHVDGDARAAMKARAAAAQAAKAETIEDLSPDQSGDGFLGDLKAKAKSATATVTSTTAAVATKTKDTTVEVGKATSSTVLKMTGVDDSSAARERAAGGGQEIKFDEDGNPIIPDGPSKGVVGGVVGTAGGLVGGVVGATGGLVGTVVGTTLKTGEGLKDAVVGDGKDAARERAAGGGQELKLDENGNPILPNAKSSIGGGIGSMGRGLAGGMGGLAGKAKAKAEAAADAAAAQAKKVVPGAEEGVPPAVAEPEIEPEQAKAIVRNSKWAKKD